MIARRAVPLLVLSLSVFFGTARAEVSFCEEYHNPSILNINIFEEVLSNHTAIAEKLVPAPFIQGAQAGSPAYEFKGSGFHISDSVLSDAIRKASCATNELTLYTSAFFMDSHTAGPALQISYARGGETIPFPLFGLYLDADSDEIQVAYRHQGTPQTETFSYRLVGGKWRQFAVSFSGNLLQVYVNCVLEFSKVVALPDYCASESGLMVTVADSADREYEETEFGVRLYAYLQNIGFQFGRHGVHHQCPLIGEDCATCGQFLNLVKRAYDLQEQVKSLEAQLEGIGGEIVTPAPTEPTSGRNCLIDDKTVIDGKFVCTTDGRICYCRDSIPDCYDQAVECEPTVNSGDNSGTPTDQGNDPGNDTTPTCTISALDDRVIKVGELAFQSRTDDRCRVYECKSADSPIASLKDCTDNFTSCDPGFDLYQQGMAKCCAFCSVCAFAECPDTSVCQPSAEFVSGYKCVCTSGYETQANGTCVDRNECDLGRQQGGHSCPSNSECVNTLGSFTCVCDVGYALMDKNGNVQCDEINECDGDHGCPENSECMDTEGSFNCECNWGYDMVGDTCLPVCDPPCQNGGKCMTPGNCTCTLGFTGSFCNRDIDECKVGTHTCLAERSECINTIGSYFCRCQPGYQAVGNVCQDVDECSLRIHNCISQATCINTFGSYYCQCPDKTNCTGACTRKGVIVRDGHWIHDGNKGCRNCTCFNGELTCRTRDCDCENRLTDPTINKTCCPQCFRRDCTYPSGDKIILIRPGSTWINPNNRCERVLCRSNLVMEYKDLSLKCPTVNCPEKYQYVPSDKCCPICLLPACDATNDPEEVVLLRNGCDECRCQDSTWNCTETVTCPEGMDTCNAKDILFYQDSCCPVCEQTALGPQACPSES